MELMAFHALVVAEGRVIEFMVESTDEFVVMAAAAILGFGPRSLDCQNRETG